MLKTILKQIKKRLESRKKAFSLLEVLVTLVIVNIILLMVSQILVISLKLSIQAHERSKAREDLTTIVNMIRRDVRNANSVKQIDPANELSINAQVQNITWKLCGDEATRICRHIFNTKTNLEEVTFQSNARLNISDISFIDQSSDAFGGDIHHQLSILFTIQAEHSVESYNIKNLYRQVLISTRNFPQ
jgi:prepilin-type N-terminal cleavage/methylation domain-containing protein